MTPIEKWQREKDKYMFDRQKEQQQPFVDAFAPMGMGGVFKAASMQDLREGGIHAEANQDVQKVREEGTGAVKEVIEILTSLREELTKFKAEATAGQTN